MSNIPVSPISTIESIKFNMDQEVYDNQETSSSSTTTTTNNKKGVAGRTNYSEWDKVTKDLITKVEEDDENEIIEEQKKLGLDGKYARSADEAIEREKAAKVKQTKRTLDKFKKRETSIIQSLTDLLHPSKLLQQQQPESKVETDEPAVTTVRITRDHLDAGKRVVSITDVNGISQDNSKIVLTSDLSLLESSMPTNVNAKAFPEDAENDVETPEQRRIFGVIKVFLSNIQNCTIIIKCKIITGTVEIHNCHNVTIQIEKDATVATIQIDLSSDMNIDFHDAVSGKNIPTTNEKKILYWGDDKDDRIFHAGVSNMHVRIYRDGFIENEIITDYIKDGAEQIGNSTLEEYQFVTSCYDGQLITENVVRVGHTTGTSVRAMTQRELAVEKEKRDRAAKCAIKMADDMIQVKDKDGNVLVRKTDVPSSEDSKEATTNDIDDDDVEEVYTTMSSTDIQLIIDECDQLKKRGNEAFSAGEYGQAILHYSLCLDKASELPDLDTDTDKSRNKKSLYPRDIIYTNRSAAFLKLGQHEKANDDASKALEIQPENIKANFRKGLALHASGQYDVALPFLVKAYKMEPNNKQIKQAIQFCEVRLEQEYRKRMSQS